MRKSLAIPYIQQRNSLILRNVALASNVLHERRRAVGAGNLDSPSRLLTFGWPSPGSQAGQSPRGRIRRNDEETSVGVTRIDSGPVCARGWAAGIWVKHPYSDPAGQGTQNWYGNLALTFTVNSPITVDELGVFNASGNGIITKPIDVGIYNNSTGTLLTSVIFSGTYTPQGYDVFQAITPITLGPGSYEVMRLDSAVTAMAI